MNRAAFNSDGQASRKETRGLITPYGGNLVGLVAAPKLHADLKAYAGTLPSITLSTRQLCDLEMLATGAFSPLDRFMGQADLAAVLSEMRLANGTLFPIPVILAIDDTIHTDEGDEVALRDSKNNILAIMSVEEVFVWARREYMAGVAGTESLRHPLNAEMSEWGSRCISGPLRVLDLPRYHDFPELRLTPAQVRFRLAEMGAGPVVAFQTRNPLHRAHEELTKKAIEKTGGILLMHPAVGMTKPGDIDHYSRIRTYRALTGKYYEPDKVLLAIAPLAMRLAGPREALWHAIIRRNYGADHFIVGRDHASPGVDENGRPFYPPYAARDLVERFSDETGVKAVSFNEFVYLPGEDRYEDSSLISVEAETKTLSGTQVREEYLNKGRQLPEWFTRPEVARILEKSFPPRNSQGVCVWFTGLSGAGKSTVAEILTEMLLRYGRRITLLDGDVVRTHLSAGLGFDKDGRDTNVRRIGFVASEITRHGGVAICAAVSPYSATRAEAREMVGANFIEVFVDTPLEVCEERDTKGLYAKARRGEITDFTGIDDVYERPETPEIRLTTIGVSPEENGREIILYLIEKGYIDR